MQKEKGARLKIAEVDLVLKPPHDLIDRPKVTSSAFAADILFDNWNLRKIGLQEQFKVMLLNRYSVVLGISTISTGSISGTVSDPKLIFAAAIKSIAASIILARNHPSGNKKPNDADIRLTHKLYKAALLLDMRILDHIILTPKKGWYYSFTDEGKLEAYGDVSINDLLSPYQAAASSEKPKPHNPDQLSIGF